MTLDDLHEELTARRDTAQAMGGPEKLQRRTAAGLLNARERLDALLDDESFIEVGRFAVSIRPEDRDRTPADGKVAGFGRVDGREVAIVSNDFTVLGASSSTVNGRKIGYVKTTAQQRGLPVIMLGESTGARMPDTMGASGVAGDNNPDKYRRERTTPWISAVLGHCYGSSSWYACMSDIVVMRKGARMAVASPRLSAMATGEDVDDEKLAGWQMHSTTSGLVDVVVETDEEALDAVRRLLGYFPAHVGQSPPRADYEHDAAREAKRAEALGVLVPTRTTQAYDMRRVVGCIVDEGSMSELKPLYGKSVVVALARLEGRPVGVVANNPMFKAGALDAEACSKVTGFIMMCDSFNIPLVFLTDQPGFLIGVDGEHKAMPGRVINWMNALSLCTVPKIAIVARKTYGQAVLNMGLGGNAHAMAAWTTAEIGFMDPSYGATIVHGVREADDPEAFAQARAEMAKGTSPYDAAATMSVHDVIDPRDTRSYLIRMLQVHNLDRTGGAGHGLMRAWPTTVI
jgi:acetyl-CoA carboxylase carboxyltransferase component